MERPGPASAGELLSRTDVESAVILLAEPILGEAGAVLIVRSARALPVEAYAIREADRLQIDPVWLNRRYARRANAVGPS